jgi:hypothetical protein
MKCLHEWSKTKFGSIKLQLEKSRTLSEQLQSMNADREEIRALADQMNELLYLEEMMWMQRSRIDWLREGDRNTKKIIARQFGGLGRIKLKRSLMTMVLSMMTTL